MTRTEEIMRLLKCDEATAQRVLTEMSCSGFCFSECTQRQFNREARTALDVIQYVDRQAALERRMTTSARRKHLVRS